MRQHTIKTPYIVGEVHCYSTEINGELVLFDCGPPTPEALASLKEQLDLSRLKYLFITHCHIDHFGLAPFIQKESDARIFIPQAEHCRFQLGAQYLKAFADLMLDIGCNSDSVNFICKKMAKELTMLVPGSYEIVEESDVPSRLGIRWLSCPGHSQSDLVYLHGRHAVTGDIMLRNIYQVPIYDIDMETNSVRFHNYNAYCASIQKLSQLRGLQIHPGHRWYVESVDETILWYVRKVLKRAHLIQEAAATDCIRTVMENLFGSLSIDPFLMHMKLSETVFTRDFLENPGQLKAALESLGLFEHIRAQYHSVVKVVARDCQIC